ncbi:MAG: hypothetical protein ACP5G2_06070 [Candidatus Bipolaricaulaceae bacterium]
MLGNVPELFLGDAAQAVAWARAAELLGGPPAGHPDLMCVAPEGQGLIGIDQVRQVLLWARYAPVRGPRRVVLIGPAQRLSREAASALLKSLEEALPHLAFVLYADAADHLLPTVRSRCATVPAAGAAADSARRLRNVGYQDHEVDFIHWLTEGRPEDVAAFTAERRRPLAEWEQWQREAAGLDVAELGARFADAAPQPIRRRAVAWALAGQLTSAPTDQLLLAAERLAEGGREVALLFLRELLPFLLQRAPQAWPELPRPSLAGWARKVSLAPGELEANANLRLLLEVILLWPKRD